MGCTLLQRVAAHRTPAVAAVLFLACLHVPVLAQESAGTVSGKILDQETGAPLAGVSVAVVELKREVLTGTDGAFAIEAVPAGTYTIAARMLAYRQVVRPITMTNGQRVTLDLKLVPDPLTLEGIVVTGSFTPRIKLESSMAVSSLSAKEIAQASPRSTTEILRYVPGFTRVESSGGEVNQNVSMRGILGVEYVMFMEDGLPVFPTMHTFFMNADNLFRTDENIEQVEVVRGGSSAVFGSNTPGAIVNFINKTGGTEMDGVIKISAGSGGLARNDLNLNGPLGDDWRFNLGGFYRFDRGIRDPGYPGIRGGQFKTSLTRLLDTGYLKLSLKHIDDRNQFILPLPFVNPDEHDFVPGFSEYGSMNTNEGMDVRVPIPTGELTLPLDDGLRTRASWMTADLGLDLGNGWKLQNTAQRMMNDQAWNAILPFDAFTADGFAQSQIQRLADQGLVDPNTATYRYVYTNHFDEFGNHAPFDTPNGIVSTGGEWHVEKPLTAFQNQLSLKRGGDAGSVAFGVYFANYTQDNRWFFTDILTDVRDNPRFLDLVVYSGTDSIEVTKNGFRNFLSNYANGSGQSTIISGAIGGDLKLFERLRAEAGVRWERNDFVQTSENTSPIDLDGDPRTVYDREPWGNGTFRHLSRDMNDWSGSLGLNYRLSDRMAAYALGSRGYKMPALDEFLVAGAQEAVELFEPRRTATFEGGIKYASERFGLTVNGFHNALRNIIGQGAVVDPVTGRVTWVVQTSPENRSYGAEVELSARATDKLRLLANATFIKAEESSGADIGSWINGVPPVIGNLSATYSIAGAMLLADVHYVARRYTDTDLGTQLPAYAYSNFGASCRIPGTKIDVAADVLNAFMSKGLEEGNPRIQEARPVFFARPLLPRRFTLSARHDF